MVVRPRRSLSDHAEKRCGDDGHFCSPLPSLSSLTPPLSPPPPALFPASQPSAFDMEEGSPPPPSSLLTPIQISSKNHLLTLALVIVSASILAVCLLCLAYYITQRYSSYRRRRADAVASTPAQPPFDEAAGELLREELVLAGGTEEPYHVWYIRTAGLDEAVIGRIAVWKYKKGEEIVDSADCAVCLGEFSDGESLRLLPKCSHAFHVSCIDTWLRSHINCPLCRAPILAPLPSPAAPGVMGLGAATVPAPGGSIVGDGDAGSDGNENILVSTPQHMADSGFNSVRPPAENSFSSEESEIWVSIDLEGNDANRSAAPPDDWDLGVDLQPVRRSISMDSSALVGVLLRTRMDGSSRDVWRKSSLGDDKKDGTGENKGKGASPAKEMERSMSGGRFFLSRFSGRGNRRAVLPL